MAFSLLASLSQQRSFLQTRKALLVLKGQESLLASHDQPRGAACLDALTELVPAFRQFGNIVWIRCEQNDAGDDVHETAGHRSVAGFELEDPKLIDTLYRSGSVPCMNSTTDIQPLKDTLKDVQLVAKHHSAFESTSLLLTLRSRLITEIFLCGVHATSRICATATDAARHGMKITVIKDLAVEDPGKQQEDALTDLQRDIGAFVSYSAAVIRRLAHRQQAGINGSYDRPDGQPDEDDEEEDEAAEESVVSRGPQGSIAIRRLPKVDNDMRPQQETKPQDGLHTSATNQSSHPLQLRQAPRTHRDDPRSEPADRVVRKPQRVRRSKEGTSKSRVLSGDSFSKSVVISGDSKDLNSSFVCDQGRSSLDDRAEVSKQHEDNVHYRRHRNDSEKTNEPWLDIIQTPPTDLLKPATSASNHPGLHAMAVFGSFDQQTLDEYERAMQQARVERSSSPELCQPLNQPLFGQDKLAESARSCIHYNILPEVVADVIFSQLSAEIDWQRMHHLTGEVPRLVCCQGAIDTDGSMPVYRHPSDRTMPLRAWTPVVDVVREAAEGLVGHSLNHVLLQLYRGGTDFISEHSDKTLDIEKGSQIVNVSFGAQRTMRLRTKRGIPKTSSTSFETPATSRAAIPPLPSSSPTTLDPSSPATPRTTYRVPLPHNSAVCMTLATNAAYLHSINADKRPAVELVEAEKAYNGQRISLTFRQIGTFLLPSDDGQFKIWGKGATAKTKPEARPVINGDEEESERLVRAFGRENQTSSVEEAEILYEDGFDVLHLR